MFLYHKPEPKDFRKLLRQIHRHPEIRSDYHIAELIGWSRSSVIFNRLYRKKAIGYEPGHAIVALHKTLYPKGHRYYIGEE